MSCGCGKRRFGGGERPPVVRATIPLAEQAGVIELAANPENCQPYKGAARKQLALLIGQGTAHEEVFLRKDRIKAERKAISLGLPFPRKIRLEQLCKEIVVDLGVTL